MVYSLIDVICEGLEVGTVSPVKGRECLNGGRMGGFMEVLGGSHSPTYIV